MTFDELPIVINRYYLNGEPLQTFVIDRVSLSADTNENYVNVTFDVTMTCDKADQTMLMLYGLYDEDDVLIEKDYYDIFEMKINEKVINNTFRIYIPDPSKTYHLVLDDVQD